MNRWLLVLGLIIPGTVIQPWATMAGGIRDFSDGWLFAPSEVSNILAGGPIPGSLAADPDSQVTDWGLWMAVGQARLYSMNDLPLTFIEGGIRKQGGWLPWALGGSWERLGESLLVDEFRQVSLRSGGNPECVIRFGRRSRSIEGVPAQSTTELELEGRFAFGLGVDANGEVGIHLHPLPVSSWLGRGSRRNVADLGVFLRGTGLALRIEQRTDGTPVFSLEVMVGLTRGVGLGMRVDPETGSVGGNLVFSLGSILLQSSHLVHPVLGPTHRFHLGVGNPEASVR